MRIITSYHSIAAYMSGTLQNIQMTSHFIQKKLTKCYAKETSHNVKDEKVGSRLFSALIDESRDIP